MSIPEDSDLELEIAHVLLIDVVGFSKLLVEGQIEVLEQLNRIVRETAHFRSAEAKGKLMRLPTGDGMALLFFDSAEEPLQCALEISRASKGYPQMRLRMGAHSGPIKEVQDVNDRSNFAGAGINLAQRVLDCGDAGHILVSERIAEDLRSYRQWHSCLDDLGICEVKHGVQLHIYNLCRDGLGNPALPDRIKSQRGRWQKIGKSVTRLVAGSRWRKVALGAGTVALAVAAVVWLGIHRAGAVPAKSIAVLPFANLSDEKSNAYFVDGVQDEILTDLSKVADLKVISRASVRQFQPGTERDLPAVARNLRVSHILEGSVQKVNNRVRVHAQLIDGATGVHLWADHYDGELADVFGIQSKIAKQIVAQLRLRLSPEVQAAIEKPPTNDFAAYDLYVRAKSLIHGSIYSARGREDLSEAIPLLTQAVARDPDFYLGWYQLAQAHDQLWHRYDPSQTNLVSAETAIATLRRLRPEAPETHLAAARHLYWVYRDLGGARAELEIAQALLPNESDVPLLIAYIDRREGRYEEALHNFQHALTLDPQNTVILHQTSLIYWQLRRYPEMAEMVDHMLALDPNNLAFRAERAQVEIEWHANTEPLHALIESRVLGDPAGAATIADTWLDLALYERDGAAAARALNFVGDDGCPVEWIPFPRSWCEGMVARLRGDEEGARAAFAKTRATAEALVRAQPRDGGAACVLAMANAALGNKEEAVRWGRQATDLWPIGKDAINGALIVGYLAIVYEWVGEKDLALEQLEKATNVPSFWSYGNLRLYPYWDGLRGDPRFEKIVASLAPK